MSALASDIRSRLSTRVFFCSIVDGTRLIDCRRNSFACDGSYDVRSFGVVPQPDVGCTAVFAGCVYDRHHGSSCDKPIVKVHVLRSLHGAVQSRSVDEQALESVAAKR